MIVTVAQFQTTLLCSPLEALMIMDTTVASRKWIRSHDHISKRNLDEQETNRTGIQTWDDQSSMCVVILFGTVQGSYPCSERCGLPLPYVVDASRNGASHRNWVKTFDHERYCVFLTLSGVAQKAKIYEPAALQAAPVIYRKSCFPDGLCSYQISSCPYPLWVYWAFRLPCPWCSGSISPRAAANPHGM